MKCPSEQEWLLEALGEVTVNTRAAMLPHVQSCRGCQAVRVRQRELLDDLSSPLASQTSEDDFVARVMARCAQGESAPPPRSRERWPRNLTLAASALAVAAAATLAWLPASRPRNDERILARGAGTETNAAADVFIARGNALEPLSDATLTDGDRLAVRVVNHTSKGRFFMTFAVDAADEVHWLFPAFADGHDNPQALELSAHHPPELLPETVELEQPAQGSLRVVSMLSDRRMNVKEVEERLRSLPKAPLARVFPESTLREWKCTWRDR